MPDCRNPFTKGKCLLLLPVFILLAYCCRSAGGPGMPVAVYQKGQTVFSVSLSYKAITDSLALEGFDQVIKLLEKTPDKTADTLLFQSYLKKGILLDVQNNNAAAKDAYLKAAACRRRNQHLGDSLTVPAFCLCRHQLFQP